MKITYYGHSCFVLESGGYKLALDPYDSMVPGYGDLNIEANKVYCSHGHMDHANVAAVRILGADRPSPFVVTEVEVPHDDAGGSKRGFNFIRIFSAEGKKVVHFGDTGIIPDDSILDMLRGADAALIPVGGVFTIDPAQAKALADAIEPGTVIPMHYRKGSQGLKPVAELSDFTCLCADVPYIVRPLEYGEVFEI